MSLQTHNYVFDKPMPSTVAQHARRPRQQRTGVRHPNGHPAASCCLFLCVWQPKYADMNACRVLHSPPQRTCSLCFDCSHSWQSIWWLWQLWSSSTARQWMHMWWKRWTGSWGTLWPTMTAQQTAFNQTREGAEQGADDVVLSRMAGSTPRIVQGHCWII